VGYEAATTHLIAAKAGTAISSLYQFFPDKAAIFKAMELRHAERVKLLYAQANASGMVHLPLRQRSAVSSQRSAVSSKNESVGRFYRIGIRTGCRGRTPFGLNAVRLSARFEAHVEAQVESWLRATPTHPF
jgi:AcrR family transcriptional regulator